MTRYPEVYWTKYAQLGLYCPTTEGTIEASRARVDDKDCAEYILVNVLSSGWDGILVYEYQLARMTAQRGKD